MSRESRDPHAERRAKEEPSEDDEWTLGSDVPDEEGIPEGFHQPNATPVDGPPNGPAAVEDEAAALGVHPNDASGETEPEPSAPDEQHDDLTLENGPSVEADEHTEALEAAPDAPRPDAAAEAGPAADGADPSAEENGKQGKKKRTRQKKEKRANKAKKGKKGDAAPEPSEDVEIDLEATTGELAAAADEPGADGEDEEREEGAGEIVSGHRFGLRLGSHKTGNLIGKLKARFKKEAETEAKVHEHEIEEAAAERIEPDERYKEVETYPIHPPYAYVRILFDDQRKDYIYQVLEPLLTRTEQEILAFIENTLVDNLTVSPEELEGADELDFITERFNDVIFDYSIILHEDEEEEDAIKKKLLYYLRRDFIGHGPVDIQMNDPYIEDISCDGPHVPIFLYHRKYESMRSTTQFGDHDKLDGYVIKMAQRSGKHISIAEPILDATMTDGSRLQATLGTEVSAGGSTFTIRKFRPDPFTPPDLVLFRTMSAEMLSYLWISVQNGASIMYAGGTASGKTTSLNAILLFIPPNMKIVSIEDTREVNLPHENWIAGITRTGFGPRDQFGRQAGEIDMFQLLKNALRQRPEYIIVGEVRGQEAYSLFQAMATGHAAYGTMHADSVDAVIHRLESDPINIPRSLLEALDIVSVQIQTRVGGKRVRRTKQISEIVGLDPHTREILTNEVFRWMPKDDSFRFSGVSYILERIQLEKGMPAGSMVKELKRRAEIIQWMIQMHIQDYQDVSRVVSGYYKEPELILSLVRGEISIEEAPSGLREIAGRTADDGNPLSAASLAAAPGTSNVKDANDGQGVAVAAASHPTAEAAVASEGDASAPQAPSEPEAMALAEADQAGFDGPPAEATAPEGPEHGGPATAGPEHHDEAPERPDREEPAPALAEPAESGWDADTGSNEEPEEESPAGWGADVEEAPEPHHIPPPAGASSSSRPLSSDEGEEWLRKVEATIRARYEELERRKKEGQPGEETESKAETTGGEDS